MGVRGLKNAPVFTKPFAKFTFVHAVKFLKSSKVKDICVIQKSLALGSLGRNEGHPQYIIIGSALSPRHLQAVSENLIIEYKKFIGPESVAARSPPVVEGRAKKSDWISCDFGVFVVHAMMPSVRERYKIENLHLFGSEFDDE